jgi:simple sugar transport system substrate-binding protein
MAYGQHAIDPGSAPAAGITLRFSDAQQKQENQIKALRSFIAQRVDVIAFSPVVETGWETVLREAKTANIPVILTDRAVEVSDSTLYLSLIGSTSSKKAARPAAGCSRYTTGAARPGRHQHRRVAGHRRFAPGQRSQEGLREIIAPTRATRSSARRPVTSLARKGKEVMEAFLKAEGKKINVLFAHNDDMAIGAIQAIEEAGLKPGTDITIISIDGVKGAFEAMIAGKLNVTVECSPLLGPQLMDAVKQVAAGKEIPKRIVTEESVFPKETGGAGTTHAQVLRRPCFCRRAASSTPTRASARSMAWTSRCGRVKCTRSWARTAPASRR